MKWFEVCIKTTEEAEDAVSNLLHEFGANGVVIEDNEIVTEPNAWDYIDESLLQKREYALVRAYFAESINISELIFQIKEGLKVISQYLDVGSGEVALAEVDEMDWANEWKKYYKPIEIGEVAIVPSWEKCYKSDKKTVIRLDPGMAFGTGTHESTALCIEAIQKYVKSNMDVIDIGTGSGILSILAKKLGAKRVLAIDIDEVAVKVAKENRDLNSVEIDILRNDLISGIGDRFDIAIANIVADIIIKLSKDISRILKEDAIFMASGIIEDRLSDVLAAFEENGLKVIETKKLNDWCLIIAKNNKLG